MAKLEAGTVIQRVFEITDPNARRFPFDFEVPVASDIEVEYTPPSGAPMLLEEHQYSYNVRTGRDAGTMTILSASDTVDPVALEAGGILRVYRSTTVREVAGTIAAGAASNAQVLALAQHTAAVLQELVASPEHVSSGGGITVKDQGIAEGTLGTVRSIDFQGSGYTVTRNGDEVTIVFSGLGGGGGGLAGITVKDKGVVEGSPQTVSSLNLAGNLVAVSRTGNEVTATFDIPDNEIGKDQLTASLRSTVENSVIDVTWTLGDRDQVFTRDNGPNITYTAPGVTVEDEGTMRGSANEVFTVNFGDGFDVEEVNNTKVTVTNALADEVEDLMAFEGALRTASTIQASVAVVITMLNRAYRLGTLVENVSNAKAGTEYTVTVAEGGAETTQHTFFATELVAKAFITQGTNLNDTNSISWFNEANDITYRIARTAAHAWYIEPEGAGAGGGGTYTVSVVKHEIDVSAFGGGGGGGSVDYASFADVEDGSSTTKVPAAKTVHDYVEKEINDNLGIVVNATFALTFTAQGSDIDYGGTGNSGTQDFTVDNVPFRIRRITSDFDDKKFIFKVSKVTNPGATLGVLSDADKQVLNEVTLEVGDSRFQFHNSFFTTNGASWTEYEFRWPTSSNPVALGANNFKLYEKLDTAALSSSGLPTGGTEGQYITRDSGGNAGWEDLPPSFSPNVIRVHDGPGVGLSSLSTITTNLADAFNGFTVGGSKVRPTGNFGSGEYHYDITVTLSGGSINGLSFDPDVASVHTIRLSGIIFASTLNASTRYVMDNNAEGVQVLAPLYQSPHTGRQGTVLVSFVIDRDADGNEQVGYTVGYIKQGSAQSSTGVSFALSTPSFEVDFERSDPGLIAFTTRGPLIATSAIIPTTIRTDGNDVFAMDTPSGNIWTTESGAPTGFFGGTGHFLNVPSTVPPARQQMNGLWVTTEVGGTEVAAVFFSWGAGTSSDVTNAAFTRKIMGLVTGNNAVTVAIQWNIWEPTSGNTIGVYWDNAAAGVTQAPANARVKVYEGGVYAA